MADHHVDMDDLFNAVHIYALLNESDRRKTNERLSLECWSPICITIFFQLSSWVQVRDQRIEIFF